MRRPIVLYMAVLLLIAGCGGDSSDAEAGGASDQADSQTETTQQVETTEAGAAEADTTEPAPATSSAGGDDGGDGGSGASTATVSLGGETYSFSTEGAVVAQCLTDLFGIFSVQLPMVDASGAQADGSVTIVALHEGTDPEVVGEVNAIEVSIGDDDWIADEADLMFEQSDKLAPGMSQVDAVEIDGRTVRGTATFFLQSSLFVGDAVETSTGTFEASCGEERTS